MRIVVVHNRYRSRAPSGEDRVVDTETAALRQAGHEVIAFERHSDDIGSWPLRRRAALPLSVVWSPSAGRELAALLRRVGPDVVHVHNTFPLLSASVLSACAAERVPAVATLHNYKLACARGEPFRDGAVCHDCSGRWGLPAVAHGCYRSSPAMTVPVVIGTGIGRSRWRSLLSALIFVSDAQRRTLADLQLAPGRSFVKWNLVPRRPLSRRGHEDLVVFAGRLDEAKGVPVLIEGWERFAATSPRGSLRLAVAGGGPLEARVRAWAGERDDVDMLGLLGKAECADLIARARAVLLPSAWEETFGLVAVEAMAAGVAVVGAAGGSLPELITDGVDGALFGPRDPSDLARVLHDVAGHPERWRERGEQARRSYEARFDPDANLDQLLAVYRFAVDHPVWSDRIPPGPRPVSSAAPGS